MKVSVLSTDNTLQGFVRKTALEQIMNLKSYFCFSNFVCGSVGEM